MCPEERNLFSADKNTVCSRRAAWIISTSIEQKEKSKGNRFARVLLYLRSAVWQ